MAIQCPKCKTRHDVRDFAREQTIRCRCGKKINISLLETVDDFVRFFESEDERKKANQIHEEAQRICRLILEDSIAEADIEIAKEKLRQLVEDYFPDKIQTYEMLYEARFKRLWDQFRS